MSPRTWLSAAHGLKVSRPGVSVLSATEAQLAFDSDKALPWLFISGTVNVAGRPSPSDPPGELTLNYGETLSALPIARISQPIDANNSRQMGTGAYTLEPGPPPRFNAHYQVVVQLDRVTFLNRVPASTTFNFALYRTA